MPFTSCSYLIALARTYSIMYKRNGESGHSCLVSHLRGEAFRISPLIMMLVVGFSIYGLYCFGVIFFYTYFVERFCFVLFKDDMDVYVENSTKYLL